MKKTPVLVEICANSYQSALNAQIGGAHRLELCASLEVGGITPSAATIQLTRKNVDLELFVLIRPRGGDFCYSDEEFEVMKENIRFCQSVGVDGIVSGVLLANGKLDVKRTAELIELSHPQTFTFHRAFDRVPDPFVTLKQLKEIGVDRILTSGQQPNALAGSSMLRELVVLSGEELTILGGSGINSKNVIELIEKTNLKEIHFSAKRPIKSKMEMDSSSVRFNNNNSDLDYSETDPKEVRKVMELLTNKIKNNF